jgi:O-antigen/teichoic acid export membrane protein
MEHARTLGRGTLYSLAAKALLVLSGYLTAIILGRWLGPGLYGVYGVVTSLVFVVTTVLMTSVEQTTSKFISEQPKMKDAIAYQIFKVQLVVSLVFAAIYFFVAPALSMLLNDMTLVPYIRYTSLLIMFQSSWSAFTGYFNGQKLFKQQSLLTALYLLIKTILIVGFVLLGYSIKGALTGFVLAALIGLLSCSFFYTLKPGTKAMPTRKILDFGVPVFLFAVITLLLMYLDLFFVKAMSPAQTADALSGYYTAALTLSRIPYYVIGALATTMFPFVSELTYQGRISKTSKYIQKSIQYGAIVLVFLAFAVASTAGALVRISYGAQYQAATIPLSILIFGGSLFSMFLLLTTVIAASGNPRHTFFLGGICVVIDFVLNYILVPRLQLNGAAIASTLSMFVAVTLSSLYIKSRFHEVFPVRQLCVISAGGLLIGLISVLVPVTGLLLLFKYALLGLLYVFFLFLFRALDREDIRLFSKVFLRV